MNGFNGGDTNLYGYVANDPVNGIDSSGLKTQLLNDGVHQVLAVDNPGSKTGVTYIEFNPSGALYSASANMGFPTTTQGWVSPTGGRVDIGSSYFGGPLSLAQTYQTTALQEQELISLATMYQFMAAQGMYNYQALPAGGANNCRSFTNSLLNTVGAH